VLCNELTVDVKLLVTVLKLLTICVGASNSFVNVLIDPICDNCVAAPPVTLFKVDIKLFGIA
jgi:hypothetical protein